MFQSGKTKLQIFGEGKKECKYLHINVVVTCEEILNHLVHFKMDRALDALSTKAKIFECLGGEPSLHRPLRSLSEEDAARNIVPEPALLESAGPDLSH